MLVFSPRGISQSQLIHCVCVRNQVRLLSAELKACAELIFTALDSDAEIELGVHVVEIQEKSRGGRRCRVLLVDGKPLDEF